MARRTPVARTDNYIAGISSEFSMHAFVRTEEVQALKDMIVGFPGYRAFCLHSAVPVHRNVYPF